MVALDTAAPAFRCRDIATMDTVLGSEETMTHPHLLRGKEGG